MLKMKYILMIDTVENQNYILIIVLHTICLILVLI